MDRIYNSALREGKAKPQFLGSDAYQVVLTMHGEVIEPRFLRLLDLADQANIALSVDHLVVLDEIRQGHNVSSEMLSYVEYLLSIGLLERVGKGKGSRIILSRGMYRAMGEAGTYTRYHGLDRETNKQLILKHVVNSGRRGASLDEFRQVIPQLTSAQVRHLVYELRDEEQIALAGWGKSARWFSTQA